MTARPSARQRLYDRAWDVARREFLVANPWCAWCRRERKLKPAKHVHHSTPHRGNPVLFWDRTRWIGLCETHHNADAQQIERRGYAARVDAAGVPTDPNHPFNRPASPPVAIRSQSTPRGVKSEARQGLGTGLGGRNRVSSDAGVR